ncbi:FAD-dependent thymidylate synthase [Candidatus Peregrinibacteria bacterium]|jgi:flavin-dependent thymidylate synthase|nr:FAD-dependent thymidylate synthase [Candidatus Peregrinibacteria bacterium]MBT4055785.1 FAD-dependent thymidylate synthase [Candidatus Peregrinibacteria bacterium]
MSTLKPLNPKVELISYTSDPYDIAVASARTCYSSRLIKPMEVNEGQRERIGGLIYDAGHHTPFQHPTFVFGLSGVSRHFVWAFLHSHPFYNSEQQSQRYVYFDEPEVFVPPFEGNLKAENLYKKAFLEAYKAYEKLGEMLIEDNFRLMSQLGKIKGQTEKQVKVDSEKKAIENARYVLPVGSATTLYHTVSGVTLLRYIRLVNACDVPYEAKIIVDRMMGALKEAAPEFLKMIGETPLYKEETLEYGKEVAGIEAGDGVGGDFAERFDKDLGEHVSKLASFQGNGELLLAGAVRDVLGVSNEKLSDDDAIDLVMDPARNPYHVDTLNSSVHSPLMRAMQHVSYTFKKKITHTADSQDQRHRMTPTSKPMLSRVHTEMPDYHIPSVVEKNPAAAELYRETMDMLWKTKNDLIEMGVSPEFAVYILPNALNLRFTQSGNLLGHLHKWRLRTCFNAQLEIYNASMDEVQQVAEVHPRIARHLGPPCLTMHRGGVRGDESGEMRREGPCPEGAHWCGIPVWRNFPKVVRPF